MAGKKENIKALFTNTRSRVIIVFTCILLIVAVIFGITQFLKSGNKGPLASDVPNSPGISSIPGALDPTVQYAKLQEAQNVNQAKSALKTGNSAIPTIVRSQALGSGVQMIGSQGGNNGLGFSALAREDNVGMQRSAWIQELQKDSCSKSTVSKVVAEGGTLSDLKNACTCIQLKDDGYQVAQLQQVCSCKELKASGFNARMLKEIGFTAERLRLCGFDACELRNAGFSAQEMKDGGYGDGELKGAGFTDKEIARASGLPDGITDADVRKADCQVAALAQLRAAGVSASAIRRISGCSATQLKAAGYTAQELRDAGYTAADLKKAGFTAAQLLKAGFSARDLLNAGFTPIDLAKAGYTPAEILAAESELPPGITPEDIKKAGCDEVALKDERLASVSAKLIKQYAGCNAQALKAAGFTDDDLVNAGFTPQQISEAPSVSDAAIRAAGCSPDKLKDLFKQNVSAKRIHALNGCSAAQLKAAGYDAKALLDAGFTPQDLAMAGFTPDEIRAAVAMGISDDAIRAAGCSPTKLTTLLNEGVSAKRIHALNGCSAAQLKAAGFDAKALLAAGFTPQELLAEGFTPQALIQAGMSPAAVIAAARVTDCSVASLSAAKAAGISAITIRQTLGCSAAAMKAAGYTAAELKAAGFTAAELKNAGFTASELKAGGFTAKELKDAGFSAQALRDAGFTASQLKEAGFSAAALKAAGFTANELKAVGFNAKELKEAGFTASELKAAGFTAKDLKESGFSANELRAAGFSLKDLQNAGYTAEQLKNAGFSPSELASVGIENSQVAGLNTLETPQGVTSNMPSVPGYESKSAQVADANAASAQQLQEIMKRQNLQMADQKYQQRIQQRTSDMLSAANQSLQEWKKVSVQSYTEGSPDEKKKNAAGLLVNGQSGESPQNSVNIISPVNEKALIKTGDIIFAVIDTSVNTDEPGPILATVVSGKFKGAKLIGSFNLPNNSNNMVISFNTMSVPGANRSTSISAYAIDANTARTALSSDTNHHYMQRYGSLFAASFLEGFGNAFQSANTQVTIGGNGGGDNITVQSGIGRSGLENAVIALATVGKSWGQVAQQQFNRPTTVQVYSGTGVGVLFTQDLASL